jgi:hypothetical protein
MGGRRLRCGSRLLASTEWGARPIRAGSAVPVASRVEAAAVRATLLCIAPLRQQIKKSPVR